LDPDEYRGQHGRGDQKESPLIAGNSGREVTKGKATSTQEEIGKEK